MRDPTHAGGEAVDASVASAFARAMDAGDLATVARLLAPECECRDGAARASGRDEVAALYRVARRWLEQSFDEVRHASAVERVAADRARIDVTTTLMRVPARWHRLRHSCELALEEGHIRSIVHGCDDAAASAFRAFVADTGASPPPPGFGV